MCTAISAKPPDLEENPQPVAEEVSQADLRLTELMASVIQQKRQNLQEARENRFKGTNLLKEAVYTSSDLGTAGFAVAQGVSLLITKSAGLVLMGSISGLIGGVLSIGQGLFLLTEAAQSLKNGQHQQCLRVAADGLLLIVIGTIMFLVSLSTLGVKLGTVASIGANPYLMPIFLFLLVVPGLIQTVAHLIKVCREKDVGSQLLNPLKRGEFVQSCRTLLLSSPETLQENISNMMEKWTEELGVEAGIEAIELLRRLLDENPEIDRQIETCREKIAAWNRMVRIRALQLLLYALTLPLGIAASLVAMSAAKIVNAVSKFFLTVPSSIGFGMDAFEPFKRNGAIAVPKV